MVQEEIYALELYRYIELSLVGAGMVEQLFDYAWSGYAINALGNERFKADIKRLTGQRVTVGKAGRPVSR